MPAESLLGRNLSERTTMAHRLFEEKHHASIYQKYRIIPPDRVMEVILEYLNKKVSLIFIHAVINFYTTKHGFKIYP